jgi:threonine dehydratase
LSLAQAYVDHCVLVTEHAIADAQAWLWNKLRLVVEPGGATAFAAIASGAYQSSPRERIGVVVCGANTDLEAFSGQIGKQSSAGQQAVE